MSPAKSRHSRPRSAAATPLYQQAKGHVITQIASGKWRANDKVISELELARRFGISRMTANRAMAELASEGYIVRMAGLGSFVADRRPHGHLLEIHSIAEEIAERGHEHSSKVVTHGAVAATAKLAKEFGIATGSQLYHSVVVHMEDGDPIQVEDRYVSPKLAAGYLDLDLNQRTASEFLLEAVPLAQAEHTVSAALPTARIAKLLQIAATEPCLLLHRRTWSQGVVASIVDLHHPGSRYNLVGRFKP